MILPSDETELSTKDKPDEENSLSTKESFTGKIGVTIGDLDKYKKDSLINIWKDANAYYSSGEEWTDEDAEFFDELAVRINTATEEGIGTVSGPAVSMIANNHDDKEEVMVMTNESDKGEFNYKNNEDETAIKDEGLNGDDGLGFGQHNESLDQILLNENYIQDQFGVFYRPVYVGENYKEHKSDLVFEGKLYTNEGVGNCPFCKGAGKITVEKLGLKDCPDCDGTGDIQGEQEMPPQMEEPVEEEKPNPFAKGGETKLSDWDYHIPKVAKNDQTWTGDIIEDNPYDNDGFNALSIHDENNCPIGHCPNHDDYRVPEDKGLGWGDLKRKYGESKANEEGTSDGAKKGWDTRGRGGSSDEDKVDNLERHHSDFMQRKGFVSGKQIEGVWEEYKSEMMPLIQQQGEITGNLAYMLEDENNHNLVRLLKDEFGVRPSSEAKASNSCGCKTKGLEANISKYEKFIKSEINVLKTRAKAGEAVGLMYGLPTVRKNGKKIKGTLAYAGVSLNDRIYLPEELAKGHGKTLPLLLNHSSTAGAEEELDRLDGEMRDHLENEKDYEVGEVTLTWDADKLTLFYEGVIENEFFQKEVDDMDMAVSLGIFYDSNSPKVCDEECYTLIKGAEFREVSLVYHAGFPIATIEAVESKLKRASIKDIKAKANEDSLIKIEDNEDADTQVTVLDEWKNETDPDVDGETKGIRTTKEAIAEEEDELPRGGSIDAEPKETDTIEQPQIIVESLQTQDSFSVRGVSGMTISNSNGIEKYAFDPTQNYSTNTIHFSVTEQGGTIFGEEMQLTPKMTTPDELTKEIESKPDIKFTDADEDILKKN